MVMDAASSADVMKHVPQSQRRRMRRWNIQETAENVLFITTPDGWEVAVSHYGNGGQYQHPVLLVHGLGSNRLAFDIKLPGTKSFPEYMVDQGFNVYAVDLRGHGLSERPTKDNHKQWDWNFSDYCELDLPAVYDAILQHSGANQLHQIGHSMGGILLYSRAGLGENRIKSGITLGSSLDYSNSPSIFQHLLKLLPLAGVGIPYAPINVPAIVSSELTRFTTKAIDTTLVNPANVNTKLYSMMASSMLNPVPAQVLRDLARIIRGEGMPSKSDATYNTMLEQRGYEFPILAVAGAFDPQCSPEISERFGTEHKVMGKAHGQQEDYGHHDLVMGKYAQQETWPMMAEWLASQD